MGESPEVRTQSRVMDVRSTLNCAHKHKLLRNVVIISRLPEGPANGQMALGGWVRSRRGGCGLLRLIHSNVVILF